MIIATHGLRGFVRASNFLDYVPSDDPVMPEVTDAGGPVRVRLPYWASFDLLQISQPNRPSYG